MNDAEPKMFETRTFDLHLLCANCQRPSTRAVTVPAEGGPGDEDEFIVHLEFRPVPFHCPHCDSDIAELIGINMRRAVAAAQARNCCDARPFGYYARGSLTA